MKFSRTTIQFTESGLEKLASIAPDLKAASHVNLWYDAASGQIAITPAPADDRDAFTVDGGKIQAKAFFGFAGIPTPVKKHDKYVQGYKDGVKLTVGEGAPAAAPEAAPAPKPKRKPWEPGDPIPTRGRKSAAQLAWIAEQAAKG